MDGIINAVVSIATDIKQKTDPISLANAELAFQKWDKSKKKNDFHSKFENDLFRACYVTGLYERRVNCFFNLLQSFNSDENVKTCFKTSGTITCIGCGPGPEIVAYFWYLRNILECRNLDIKFIGIDCIKEWEIYIDALREKLDDKTEVEFRNETVGPQLIANMNKGKLCLMSYPHWSNLPNIWTSLKSKFEMIIVLDVNTKSFKINMSNYGYKKGSFCDNGSKLKIFYYHVEENTPPLVLNLL